MDDVIPADACLCVFACMYAWMHTWMHASVCGYLTVKVSRETDDDSTWIWAEGRILLKRGMAITFCVMTITSHRDVEAAGVRNMGTVWRWAEVAEDGRCGFREVFNLYSRSDAPLNKRQKGAALCICRAVSTCGWKYEGVILCWLLFLCWARWVGLSVNFEAWGVLVSLWEHKIIEIYWKFARQSRVPISDCKSQITAPLICTNV